MKEFTREERYIIDESQEISVGEVPDWFRKLTSFFPALRNKNYRLYFMGQLVSLIGTWLQIVAQGWLVLELTNSVLLIGLVAAVSTLPTLLFSLFGGVIVDRFNKQKIIIFTQSASMILALILGLLTVFKIINVWQIMTLAFLLGVVNAVDMPARQAFVVEMVGKPDLASAIALNSGIFNGARVIGPSIAGILIGLVGTGGAFILNGASYLAVILALFYIKARAVIHKSHPHPLLAIKDGISYSYGHPKIFSLLALTSAVAVFGWSYTTVLPVIAKQTFHLDATGLGYLYAAAGLGAILATILVSAYANKVNPILFIVGGNTLFAIAIFAFTMTSNLFLAYIFLFFAGLGILSEFATINTTIQHLVEDRFRGRVMSIYSLVFVGLFPLGNFQIGFLGEHFGVLNAIRVGAVIVLLAGAAKFATRGRVEDKHKRYLKNRPTSAFL